ncbi:DUF2894 domain-containing protein [Limnohabitans sp. G3-2]|uniref:DUF2894 domain-containing protein n=1 Tax=Limnohabitans sp. G3-2 TaxID=1100711 RepID=UPI000C1ED2BB|nr:DUF2894 domain-containing protein [Limnohabitans sp. G3-2]PIT75025.1 hypothetical protein B9Z31_08215 [Limnohabitans sp. G3-2]
MNDSSPALPDLDALRASGAARVDAVGWHYIETLAKRTREQSGPAQMRLVAKLQEALDRLETRMDAAALPLATPVVPPFAAPAPSLLSPLAALLQDMAPKNALQGTSPATGWRLESPRIAQFRKQLSQISVQKQVKQAMAQAPQNAGPINSHMLVLRSLGLMRDISPDYLNRFMAHVDTLLCLDEAGKGKSTPKKASPAPKGRP